MAKITKSSELKRLEAKNAEVEAAIEKIDAMMNTLNFDGCIILRASDNLVYRELKAARCNLMNMIEFYEVEAMIETYDK